MIAPTAWRWISRAALIRLHEMSLAQFGGASGIRDEGLLDSALARPEQLAHYGTPDLAEIVASYAYGLAKNHAFIDGNKRAAFLALGLSLRLNGSKLVATQVEATQTVLAVASSDMGEEKLAEWIRNNIQKID